MAVLISYLIDKFLVLGVVMSYKHGVSTYPWTVVYPTISGGVLEIIVETSCKLNLFLEKCNLPRSGGGDETLWYLTFQDLYGLHIMWLPVSLSVLSVIFFLLESLRQLCSYTAGRVVIVWLSAMSPECEGGTGGVTVVPCMHSDVSVRSHGN